MKLPVYLDNHSTTQVDPRVVDAMLPFFTEHFGNAASRQHQFGWDAEAAVENARKQISTLLGATNEEIVFTSGATESINLALKGVAESYASKGRHIITAATEHKAVLDSCKRLEKYGFTVTYLPVDRYGLVSAADIDKAITSDTIIVSIMMANNEIGTIAAISEIGAVCKSRNVLFHTDATQAVGKIPVDVRALNVDLVSFSAHKMYGPKGIGALYVRSTRPAYRLSSQIDGGGHEHGLRSGTLNVPSIVGFGKACEIARTEMDEEADRLRKLRDHLVGGLTSTLENIWVNGHPEQRLPQNANVTFAGVRSDRLLMEMKNIAVSTGSACSSTSSEPSHVLAAIGLSKNDAMSSIRFGLGRFTTSEEIDYTIERAVETVKKEREKISRFQLT